MAQVTKTVGTSSRDYSTFTAALADNDAYSASGDTIILEGYNDSTFNETITVQDVDAVGVTSITVTVAASDRHDGTAGTGARVVRTSAVSCISQSIAGATKWLEVHITSGTETNGNIVSTNNTSASIQNMIIHSTSTVQFIKTLLNVGPVSNSTESLTNNIVYTLHRVASSDASGIFTASGVTPSTKILNNTVYDITVSSNTGYGIRFQYSGAGGQITNNIAMGNEADLSIASGPTRSYNMSEDASATGTGSLASESSSNEFVSTTGGSEDFHLASTANAIGAGTDLGTSPSGVEIDIDGRDRDAEGDTWDMGADQYVAVGGGTIVKDLISMGIIPFAR